MKTLSIAALSAEFPSRPFFSGRLVASRQMRALHALLSVALAAAVAAVPVAGATFAAPAQPQADAPRTLEGSAEVLTLADGVSNRSATDGATLDLGPVLSAASEASSDELVTTRELARVREADDPDAALTDVLDRIAARADGLGRTQRAALGAFADGEADARTTLRTLVGVHREAAALADRRERVVDAARARGATVPEGRVAALDRELALYTGPVRARVAAALTGDAPPARTYLATTPRGVTLATLGESGYVRETYRGELRQTGASPLSASGARSAVERSYPALWDARIAVDAVLGRLSTVRVTYEGGELAATVGSGNERVFRDVHRQSLDVAGTGRQAINVRDGLRLTVDRSYAGGPMRVRLESRADETPVNGSLSVGPEGGDSVTIGPTGSDGERWVLTPGERFTIVAIVDQSVVFITMDPLDLPETAAG